MQIELFEDDSSIQNKAWGIRKLIFHCSSVGGKCTRFGALHFLDWRTHKHNAILCVSTSFQCPGQLEFGLRPVQLATVEGRSHRSIWPDNVLGRNLRMDEGTFNTNDTWNEWISTCSLYVTDFIRSN